MQTRSLAAASGAGVLLGLSLLALRPAVARSGGDTVAPGEMFAATLAPLAPPQLHEPGTPDEAPPPAPAVAAEPPPELRAQLALTIADPLPRTRALAEALAAWAATDAGAALVWLAQHAEQDAPPLLAAIGEGLAADPAGETFALTFLAQDHEHGADLAGALVRRLAERNRSAAAARLACATPEGCAHEWATVAFATLAFEDSATALTALDSVAQPALHRTATAALIAGWAERDPAELARSAAAFARPEDRSYALDTAAAKRAGVAAPASAPSTL